MQTSTRWFRPHNSSLIDEVRFNVAESKLYIRFHGGKVYRYNLFPVRVYNEFTLAESKGSFFHQKIRPFFTAARVPTGFPKAVEVEVAAQAA